jgi:hypothetical protein
VNLLLNDGYHHNGLDQACQSKAILFEVVTLWVANHSGDDTMFDHKNRRLG